MEVKEKPLIAFTAPKEKHDDLKIGPPARGIVSDQVLFKDTAPKRSAVKWVTRATGTVPGHIAMDPY
jgi:hypothetical protein